MSVWLAPWHLLALRTLRHRLDRVARAARVTLAERAVSLALRLHPDAAKLAMAAIIVPEASTAIQPVVRHEVAQGITPYAVQLGKPLHPPMTPERVFLLSQHLGNIAAEINWRLDRWDAMGAYYLAHAALDLGAARFDEALRHLADAGGALRPPADVPQEPSDPWPQNEPPPPPSSATA